MATADQVKALVKSHADGDDDRFYSVALQVAAQASRSGHSKLAKELRDLVDGLREEHRIPSRAKVTPLARPDGELASLLSVSYPTIRLSTLSFSPSVYEKLSEIVGEHRNQQLLSQHGMRPTNRILFTGPPGTGKTSSARAIASELSLPLFSVRLDSLITKYLGESAAKLRLIFESIEQIPGVYLFDEVDALAGSRNNPNEVGEIRRFLNTFLILMEQADNAGLVIAATNHPSLIDTAMFRRFEDVVSFPLPDWSVAMSVLEGALAKVDVGAIDWKNVRHISEGLSHSELTLAASQATKRSILNYGGTLTSELLIDALQARVNIQSEKEW